MLQKIYSLPNCLILVEGLSTTEDQKLNLLTRFSCQVGGVEISGGKELLCNLIKGISYACQSLMAGEGAEYEQEQISIGTNGFHYQLTVAGEEGKVEVKLDRVQLFDLMEALDQLCLDPQTLPDVGLMFPSLNPPVSSLNPLVPAVVGISSVVAVAFALWFVPIPDKRQEAPAPTSQERVLPPQPQIITDPAELEKLRSGLFELIDREWRNPRTFEVPLTYRVTVNQAGAIIGYKETQATREILAEQAEEVLKRMEEELPLEKLLRQNLDSQNRSVATFIVKFDITNQVEVTQEAP
jgi:hypothetical protein